MIDNDPRVTARVEDFFSTHPALVYKKGDVILRADDTPSGVYFLCSGYIRQYVISESGETFMVHVYKPGSFFPLMWAINDIPNTFNFEAMTQVRIVRAPKSEFIQFIRGNPDVLWYAMQKVVAGLYGMATRVSQLVLDDAYVKTALLLVYFGKNFGRHTSEGVVLDMPLTHREIAFWIGTTRETASIQIEKLQKNGLLRVVRRQMTLPSLDALARVSRVI